MSTSLAFVFPGQGSLSMGTLADFGAENPVILETFKEASKALGYNLWALVQEGPQEQLDQPEKAEPAILTVSIALWRLWLENGGPCPAFVSGHGFGEYSALVAAGSLSLDTAATAELNDGAMVTILGLEDADVVAICGEAAKDQVVSVTYFNSPGQVVIAGHKAAVNRATELCKAKGAKRVVPTAGNVPSHCALMKPAAGRFSAMVDSVEWMTPHMPVVRNVTATVAADLDTLKQDLMVELYQPVHWVECVRTLARNGVVSMVECGPGRALAALNKRCADGVTTYGINSPDQLATTRAALS